MKEIVIQNDDTLAKYKFPSARTLPASAWLTPERSGCHQPLYAIPF